MDKAVKRITVVKRTGDTTEGTVIYRQSEKDGGKASFIMRGLERAARRYLVAKKILADEALRRHDKSNSQRANGWIYDAPVNALKSRRKAYNEGRKAMPLGLLPKI